MRHITTIAILSVSLMTGHAQDFLDPENDNTLLAKEEIATIIDDFMMVGSEDGERDDEEGTASLTECYERLTTMALTPRNINAMDIDGMLEIPFMDEETVYAILNYRAIYGDMRSMTELEMIPRISSLHRRLLRLLFYAAPLSNTMSEELLNTITPGNRKRNRGTSTLTATLRTPLYSRRGYMTATTDGGYHGPNVSHTMRYRYSGRLSLSSPTRITAALTASQDYGEAFFTQNNKKGWDYYGGFVRLTNTRTMSDSKTVNTGPAQDIKRWTRCTEWLTDVIIGNYDISNGSGLILPSATSIMSPSLTTLATSTPQASFRMRGHASRSEAGYMQGIAITLTPWRKEIANPGHDDNGSVIPMAELKTSLFASYRNIDASISHDNDAMGMTTITSIIETGYHRTDTEIERHNTATETTMGFNATMRATPFLRRGNSTKTAERWLPVPITLGVTAMYTHLSIPLLPNKSQAYRYFVPQGSDFAVASMTYSLLTAAWQVSGETALSGASPYAPTEALAQKDGISIATCNTVRWKPWHNSNTRIFGQQRYYNYRFGSLYSNAFGTMHDARNESGAMVGITMPEVPISVLKGIALTAYANISYHPWARYGFSKTIPTPGSATPRAAVACYPSRSWEHYLAAEYTHRALTASLRYRYRENSFTGINDIMPMFDNVADGTAQHLVRLKVKYDGGTWSNTAQIHCCSAYGSEKTTSNGVMIANALRITMLRGTQGTGMMKWRGMDLGVAGAYFHTDDYASRLYVHEPALLYSNASTMLYGHGYHLNGIANAHFGSMLTLSLSATMDHYFDRDVIGTGMQMINGRNRATLVLQGVLKW